MATRTTPKRKAKPVVDVIDEDGDEESEQKKKKQKSKPTGKTEPYKGAHGWEIEPKLYLLSKSFGRPRPSKKIAAFDLDGTLITRKRQSQMPFNVSPDDWKWFNKKVPHILEEYHDKGFAVVIFSNQNSIKSAVDGKAAANVTKRIENALSEVKVPIQAFLATEKNEQRKPEIGMWEFFLKHHSGGIEPDLKESFYVGDMAGRPEDIDVTDKQFAEKIGIKFMTPEDAFGKPDGKQSTKVDVTAAADGKNFNPELTDVFRNLADLHKGDRFKFRAYDNVAKAIEAYDQKILSGKQVSNIKGIGKASVAKIDEYLTTGKVAELDEAGLKVSKAEDVAAAPPSDALKFL